MAIYTEYNNRLIVSGTRKLNRNLLSAGAIIRVDGQPGYKSRPGRRIM